MMGWLINTRYIRLHPRLFPHAFPDSHTRVRLFLILVLMLGSMAAVRAEEERPMLPFLYADAKGSFGKFVELPCDYVEKRTVPAGLHQLNDTVSYWAHIVGPTEKESGFVVVRVRSNQRKGFEIKYGLRTGPFNIARDPKKLEGQFVSTVDDLYCLDYRR